MKTKFNGFLTLLLVLLVQLTFAQEKTVSGVVSDASGPLPGVTVLIKGTKVGTQTDFDGNYSIKATVGSTLQFSYVGMTSVDKVVGESNSITVTMTASAQMLDEIVVTGYGIKKRGVLSTSISTVNSEQLDRQNNTISIDNALQGAATGVQVVAQNGKPGNAAFVRIRGVGSINAGNEPLYLLDGVQVDEDDIIGINPSDISSLSVLKDAASTAIYGARGSNGVVIITSKTGKKNTKAIFKFSSKTGTAQEIKRNFRVMNAQEKLDYERAIGVGVGASITSQSEWDELLSNNHNWSDDLLKKSKINSIGLSVTGGEDKLSYFMSLSNDSDTGIIQLIEKGFERSSARLNIDYSARDWLTISTKLTFSTANNQDSRDRNNIQSPVVGRFSFNPYEPVYLLDSNGDFIPNSRGLPTYNPTHQGLNSLAQVRANEDNDTNNRWVGSLSTNMRLAEGLNYTFALSGSYIQRINRHILHSGSALDLIFSGTPTGRTSIYNESSLTSDFLNKISYDKTFNEKHKFLLTLLSEYQQNDTEYSTADAEGFVVNGPTTLNSGSTPRAVSGGDYTSRLFSLAANLNYVFNDTYIIDGTIRRDGSSRFGADTKYGIFWGASAAWNIHKENFFGNLANTFDLLKLRISAGTSGNDNIGLNPSKTLYGFGSYNGANSAAPNQFGDPNLSWEENFTVGAGLEFGLFNSRIKGVVEYYKRTTSQLLLNVPISLAQGGGSITKNVGEIENSGFEFELRGDIIRNDNFTWNIGASLSLYDNKVTKLADDNDLFTTSNYYTGLRVGEEVHTFYLPRYAGVNPANGQALFLDTNDNITTSNDGAEVFLSGKSPFAKLDGGINTNMTYNGFFLSADLYYKAGNYIFNTVEQQLLSDGVGATDNQRVDAWNYWKQPGDVNVLPDPTANNPFRNEANGDSDRFLQKGDFIRLRNVQIGYSLPSKFLDKMPISQLKLYVTGTNLWTYAPWYKGDPEVGIPSGETTGTRGIIPGEFSLNSYPTLSSYMFGVDIKF